MRAILLTRTKCHKNLAAGMPGGVIWWDCCCRESHHAYLFPVAFLYFLYYFVFRLEILVPLTDISGHEIITVYDIIVKVVAFHFLPTHDLTRYTEQCNIANRCTFYYLIK